MPSPAPSFVEVLQIAVNAAGTSPQARMLVVQRVLQQLGTPIPPEVTRAQGGVTYTWKGVPLVGDLVLGVGGVLVAPGAAAARPCSPPANGHDPEDDHEPIRWATHFQEMRDRCDPAELKRVLRNAAKVLLRPLPSPDEAPPRS